VDPRLLHRHAPPDSAENDAAGPAPSVAMDVDQTSDD
jgi:hypothetical protein